LFGKLAANVIAGYIGKWPRGVANVTHNPCSRREALDVTRIKGIMDTPRLVWKQVNNMSGKIEGLIPAADIENAGGAADTLS